MHSLSAAASDSVITRPIFIGGMPRSGTTLLRAMLDRHPSIACGPEMRVIPALANFSAQTKSHCGDTLDAHYGVSDAALGASFRKLIEGFLGPYQAKRGKKRIAEKTPANVLHFGELNALFPDADFIHVIRDGRDVVASLLTMNWTEGRTGRPMAITRDPATAAASWAAHVRKGLEAKQAGRRVFEIRYEDLVADPKTSLADLFDFLGEPWSDDALSFHLGEHVRAGVAESSAEQISKPLYVQSVSRWRQDLSEPAKAAVKQHAGALLKELGYAVDHDW